MRAFRFLTLALVMAGVLFTGTASRAAIPFPGTATNFNGTSQYTFLVGTGTVSVLCPQKAAPGNPWMLVGSLYSLNSAPVANMTRVELELVKRGFHVVVSDPGNTFGAPEAIAKWDGVYAEMTGKYGLSKKISLMGVSREGLAITRWAAGHPGAVACLYMDKAVCDFKSWPGGKLGISKGSPENWQSLIKLYHFESESEALAWKQNPIDLAAKLAADHVAIIYVTGEKDDAVPYSENGARMEEIYKKNGGIFQLIRKENEGHHPHGIPDPKPVVDFIQHATTNSVVLKK